MNIDVTPGQGIDAIFAKVDAQGNVIRYIIVESKYAQTILNTTNDGIQMSQGWILGSNRILNAVNGNTALAAQIALNYKPYIARIFPNGLVEYHSIDNSGTENSTITSINNL